jgi:hypothetical protein
MSVVHQNGGDDVTPDAHCLCTRMHVVRHMTEVLSAMVGL